MNNTNQETSSISDIGLKELDEFKRAILDSTSCILVATKIDGTISFFNAAAENALGYTANDVVGKHTPALWHNPEEVKHHSEVLSKELGRTIEPGFRTFVEKASQGLVETNVWTFRRKDGTSFPGELTPTAIRDNSNQIVGFLGTIKDISERIDIDALQKRLSLATRSAGIGIWDWSIIENKVVWTDAMFTLYGLDKNDYIRSGEDKTFITYDVWKSSLHPEDAARAQQELFELLEPLVGINKFDTSFRIIWPDGSVHHIRAIAEVSLNDSGDAVNVVGVNWDSTAVHEASRAKNEFLSMISHEIRTPLNGLVGTIDILSESKLDEIQKKYISIIKKTGRMLLDIINEVLDFSKLEEGRLNLIYAPFSISRIIEEQLFLFKPIADEKNLFLHLDMSSSITDYLVGDAGRIRQVFGNLLSNALKFTSEGGIKIKVEEVERFNDENIIIKISVLDTGEGISPEKIHLLFMPFVQVSNSSIKQASGTGLGLSICKRLVEMMNGHIGVESVEKQGSNFWFTLKLAVSKAGSEEIPKPKEVSTAANFTGKRILIVEDVETNQFVISVMLGSLGCTYDIAVNGKEAVEYVNKNKYDVVLMDCMMPIMDGYQATKEIRDNGFKGLPILALTANAMNEDRERVLEAGMNDFIPKPIVKRDIISALSKWIKD